MFEIKNASSFCPLFLHNIFQTKNLYSMALIQPRTDRSTIFRVTKMLSWEHGFPSGIQLKAAQTTARYFKKRYDFCINWGVETWICVTESRFLHCYMQGMRDIIRRSQNICSLQDFFFSPSIGFVFIYRSHLAVPKALEGVPTPVCPRQKQLLTTAFKIPTMTHQY